MDEASVVGVRRTRFWFPVLLAAAVSLGAVMLAPCAEAAFPGQNGKLVFVRSDENYSNYRLHVLNPDGPATLLGGERVDSLGHPEWSPDGTQIVYESPGRGFIIADANGATLRTVNGTGDYVDNPSWTTDGRIVYDFRDYECQYGDPQCYVSNWGLRVMNADGTNDVQLTWDGGTQPAWSPNGDKVAFVGSDDAIHVANTDGSNDTTLSSDSSSFNFWDSPAWSPDGEKLVFNSRVSPGNLWMINADGSGLRQLTRGSQSGAEADWSPDGSLIVFTYGASLLTIRPDGTNLTRLTATSHDGDATWQPVKPPGYARPRAATPVSIRLVPASKPCTTPNSTHGAPLSSPSCSPPSPSSDFLTVGTPDANLMSANFTGLVSLKAISPSPDPSDGDQADVTIQTSLTDIRKRDDLTDYTGEVALVLPLRVTDRYNGTQYSPLIHPATANDAPLKMSIACTATADVTIGSTCSGATSADALMPGIALERERAGWQLGQVQVFDGGPDGDADTAAGNTLFAVQGLFAP